MAMNLWLVGSNPSPRNVDPNVAFLGTSSYQTLSKWMEILGVTGYGIVNVSNEVRVTGKPTILPRDLFNLSLKLGNATHVIALGNVASEALKRIGVRHFKLPHPSGRNRQLNDPNFIIGRLEECKKYLERI